RQRQRASGGASIELRDRFRLDERSVVKAPHQQRDELNGRTEVVRWARCALQNLFAIVIFITLINWYPCRAVAEEDDNTWPVNGRLLSKDGSKSKDISGIACKGGKFPRACLVIDDNRQDAQFVTVDDGDLTAGDSVSLITNQFKEEPLELDGEGVAYADGSFYVMGSHGHPRNKKGKLDEVTDKGKIRARITAASQVIRV